METVVLKGFDRLQRAMSAPRVRRLLRKNVGMQIRRATETLRLNVNRYIETERHGIPNSPLTILAKGSSKPLVDRGDLRQGIETDHHEGPRSIVGQVGVSRTRRKKGGGKLINVALSLHEGTTVKVTEEVRKAVFAAIRERTGKSVKFDGKGGSKTWRIRGRPFIRVPFEEYLPMAKRRIQLGIKRTIEEL